ncbi:MAG: hypothetical protein GTO63_26430 [Anaerolineae bacterium]|nr:hypothetical protein [Anaerolineae bacterium]NIN98273.1 hypothetical protein [Anaerolineae bacterium]NIQ81202.1 hypothetical protein [Anaerolineae bacterium]
MRRTLTALILLSATLFILQGVPFKEMLVRSETSVQEGTYAEWTQTTLADFELGERDCTALSVLDDGEVSLSQEEGAEFCPRGSFTSAVHESSVVFNMVGAAWAADRPPGTTFHLEVRASRDRRAWTDWTEVPPDEDGLEMEELTHGNLIEVSPSRYLQYRLILGTFDASMSPLVRELVFALMNTRDGPGVEEARAMILPQEATSGVPQPRIISRRGWGANEAWATRKPIYRQPTTFVIHHTVTPNNPEDPAYIVRAIYQYHAISRGWGDIGYNFLIDRQGNVYEGRKGGDGVVGIHARDYSYGSIGIALLGDYRYAKMTPAMKEALISLMAWEADRFNIHPLESSYFIQRKFPHLVAHRDLWPTICPGDNVYKVLPELRQQTWQRLLAHKPRVEIASPEAGEAVSGVTEVRLSSPSPTTSRIQLYLDGTVQKESTASLTWTWNTRQFIEGQHRIEAVATSIQGRTSRVVREVIVDNTLPTGSVEIDEGASYTSQLTVTLSLEAEDDRSDIAGMKFTHDGASQFSEVEEFASTKEWVLSSGDGEKTIGVRFLDQAGNTSATYTDTIGLDTVTPGDWDSVDMDESGGVVVEVFDHGSGLDPSSAVFSVSSDGGLTWGAWQPVSCDAPEGEDPLVTYCRLSAGMAGADVRFRIADRAGNEGLSPAYGESARPTPGTTPGASPLPTASPTLTVTPDLPSSDLPDLVVDGITVTPEAGLDAGSVGITVTIGNRARVEIATGFWVELFVDPPTVPTINSIAVADGVGAFWYVPSLGAQESLSLSLEDVDGRYTNFGGSLPTGRHELYAYADAYNPEGEAGLVSEVDEANNLVGPVIVQIGDGSDADGSEPVTQGAAQALRIFLDRLEGLLAVLRRYVGSERG